MLQEEIDFLFFEQNQLAFVDFSTGQIDVKAFKKIYKDVGSKNEDGYIRIWCNHKLRMKHRLLYWLYHHKLPKEIDHINHIRDDNRITNLQSVTHAQNTKGNLHKGRKHFTSNELHSICKLIAQRIPDGKIAKQFNCTRTAIMGIRTKYRHKDIADMYF